MDKQPDVWGDDSDEQRFIDFYYPEIKDLAKHFLTLISGAIVLSATFAEKFVDLSNPRAVQVGAIVVAWLELLTSMGSCGIGLYTSFMAAEQAAGGLIYDYEQDFRLLARKAYRWLDRAGLSFGVGLALLILTAVLKLVLAK